MRSTKYITTWEQIPLMWVTQRFKDKTSQSFKLATDSNNNSTADTHTVLTVCQGLFLAPDSHLTHLFYPRPHENSYCQHPHVTGKGTETHGGEVVPRVTKPVTEEQGLQSRKSDPVTYALNHVQLSFHQNKQRAFCTRYFYTKTMFMSSQNLGDSWRPQKNAS